MEKRPGKKELSVLFKHRIFMNQKHHDEYPIQPHESIPNRNAFPNNTMPIQELSIRSMHLIPFHAMPSHHSILTHQTLALLQSNIKSSSFQNRTITQIPLLLLPKRPPHPTTPLSLHL